MGHTCSQACPGSSIGGVIEPDQPTARDRCDGRVPVQRRHDGVPPGGVGHSKLRGEDRRRHTGDRHAHRHDGSQARPDRRAEHPGARGPRQGGGPHAGRTERTVPERDDQPVGRRRGPRPPPELYSQGLPHPRRERGDARESGQCCQDCPAYLGTSRDDGCDTGRHGDRRRRSDDAVDRPSVGDPARERRLAAAPGERQREGGDDRQGDSGAAEHEGNLARIRAPHYSTPEGTRRAGRNRSVMSRAAGERRRQRFPGTERAAPSGAALTGPAGIEPATPGFGDRCSTN